MKFGRVLISSPIFWASSDRCDLQLAELMSEESHFILAPPKVVRCDDNS